MSSPNQILKKVNTDVSSATADISIRKQHRNNTLIEQQSKTKNESQGLIILENDHIRKDIYGNEIKKGGKQKISFIDDPILNDNNNQKEKNKMIDVINVESYKDYNKLMAFTDYKDEKYIYMNEAICCESCFIF